MPADPPIRFASRVAYVEPFLAMEVMERAFDMERAGTRVIHLEIGEPDLPPPRAAIDACKRALDAGETHYSSSLGLPDLRRAIADDYGRRHALQVDPDCVIVTSGTSAAMLLVFTLLVEPGDEVVLATPHYPCYPNFIRVAGGVPVLVPTRAADGYRLDVEAVRDAVTERTRAIVIASPANPTGAVQDPETVHALGRLGVPLISDEVYDGLVYDAAQVTSGMAASPQAFVLDGFSKRYAMTGFRLGYVIAPAEAIRPLQVLQQSLLISANRFVQYAGIAALEAGGPTVARMREVYGARRRLVVEGLRSVGLDVPSWPRGAFYVFADARRFDRDSRRLALRILEEVHVAVTPGIDFGQAGEGWLRVCCTAPEDALSEALARLKRLLA